MIRTFLTAALLSTSLLSLPFQASGQQSDESHSFNSLAAATSSEESEADYSPGFMCYEVQRSMRVLNPRVMVGEPLYLEIRLEGHPRKEGEEARFVQALRFGKDLQVLIRPPSGAPFPYTPPDIPAALQPNVSFEMAKGETKVVVRTIGYDNNSVSGGLFDTAGQYVLDFWMDCNLPGALSPESQELLGRFVIDVWMPQPGSQDLIALNTLMSANDPEIFLSLQNMSLVKDEHAQYFQSIIEQAPESKLYGDSLLILANHSYRSMTGKDDQNVQVVIDMFNEALETEPNHFERINIYMRLLAIHTALGNEEKRFEYLKKLWQDPAFISAIDKDSAFYKEIAGEAKETVEGQWMMFEEPGDAMRPGADVDSDADESPLQRQVRQAVEELKKPGSPDSIEIKPDELAP